MFELYRDELVDLLFLKQKNKAVPVLDIKKDVRGTVKARALDIVIIMIVVEIRKGIIYLDLRAMKTGVLVIFARGYLL